MRQTGDAGHGHVVAGNILAVSGAGGAVLQRGIHLQQLDRAAAAVCHLNHQAAAFRRAVGVNVQTGAGEGKHSLVTLGAAGGLGAVGGAVCLVSILGIVAVLVSALACDLRGLRAGALAAAGKAGQRSKAFLVVHSGGGDDTYVCGCGCVIAIERNVDGQHIDIGQDLRRRIREFLRSVVIFQFAIAGVRIDTYALYRIYTGDDRAQVKCDRQAEVRHIHGRKRFRIDVVIEVQGLSILRNDRARVLVQFTVVLAHSLRHFRQVGLEVLGHVQHILDAAVRYVNAVCIVCKVRRFRGDIRKRDAVFDIDAVGIQLVAKLLIVVDDLQVVIRGLGLDINRDQDGFVVLIPHQVLIISFARGIAGIVVDHIGVDRVALIHGHRVVIPGKAGDRIASPRGRAAGICFRAGLGFHLPDLVAFQTRQVQGADTAAGDPVAIRDRTAVQVVRLCGSRVGRAVLINDLYGNRAGTTRLQIIAGGAAIALFAPVRRGNDQLIRNGQDLQIIGYYLMIIGDCDPFAHFRKDLPAAVPITRFGDFAAVIGLVVAGRFRLFFRAAGAAVGKRLIQQTAPPVLQRPGLLGRIDRQHVRQRNALLRCRIHSRNRFRVIVIVIRRAAIGDPVFHGQRIGLAQVFRNDIDGIAGITHGDMGGAHGHAGEGDGGGRFRTVDRINLPLAPLICRSRTILPACGNSTCSAEIIQVICIPGIALGNRPVTVLIRKRQCCGRIAYRGGLIADRQILAFRILNCVSIATGGNGPQFTAVRRQRSIQSKAVCILVRRRCCTGQQFVGAGIEDQILPAGGNARNFFGRLSAAFLACYGHRGDARIQSAAINAFGVVRAFNGFRDGLAHSHRDGLAAQFIR